MKEYKIKNESNLELTITSNWPEECDIRMGGDNSNPTWEEYIDGIKSEYFQHFELIKKAISECGLLGEKAGNAANDTVFVFSDGFAIGFTWRAWGDLMQAIVGKREGYMKYYC